MANKKISALDPLGRNALSTDELPLQPSGSAKAHRVTGSQLAALLSAAPATAFYVVTAADGTLSNEVLLSDVIGKGTLASRPAFGTAGRLYFVTDAGNERWTRDTGSAWEDVGVDWDFVTGKPASFAPSSHGSSVHTGNIFPGTPANQSLGAAYFDVAALAAPAAPAAGTRRIYLDSTSGKLSVRTSGGTTVSLEESGGGSSINEWCRLRMSGNLSISATTDTAIGFDLEDADTSTFHSTVTNNSRATIPATGRYFVHGAVLWPALSSGQRRVWLRKNGTTVLGDVALAGVAVVNFGAQVTETVDLTAGDYIELMVWSSVATSVLAADSTRLILDRRT